MQQHPPIVSCHCPIAKSNKKPKIESSIQAIWVSTHDATESIKYHSLSESCVGGLSLKAVYTHNENNKYYLIHNN